MVRKSATSSTSKKTGTKTITKRIAKPTEKKGNQIRMPTRTNRKNTTANKKQVVIGHDNEKESESELGSTTTTASLNHTISSSDSDNIKMVIATKTSIKEQEIETGKKQTHEMLPPTRDSNKSLKNDVKLIESSSKYKCPHCNAEFNSTNLLQRHLPIHIKSKEKFILMTHSPIVKSELKNEQALINIEDENKEGSVQKPQHQKDKKMNLQQKISSVISKSNSKLKTERKVNKPPLKLPKEKKTKKADVVKQSLVSQAKVTLGKPKPEAPILVYNCNLCSESFETKPKLHLHIKVHLE